MEFWCLLDLKERFLALLRELGELQKARGRQRSFGTIGIFYILNDSCVLIGRMLVYQIILRFWDFLSRSLWLYDHLGFGTSNHGLVIDLIVLTDRDWFLGSVSVADLLFSSWLEVFFRLARLHKMLELGTEHTWTCFDDPLWQALVCHFQWSETCLWDIALLQRLLCLRIFLRVLHDGLWSYLALISLGHRDLL